MKTRNLFYALLAFAAISCAKEIAPETVAPEQDIKLVPMTFLASIDDNSTKTAIENGYQMRWNANDAVAVFDNVLSDAYHKFNADAKAAVAQLNGTASDGATEFYAVYPYRDNNNLKRSGNQISGCFMSPDQRPGVGQFYASCHYMMAKSDDTKNFVFQNVNSFIKFTLGEDLKSKVKAIYLFGNNDEDLSGEFTMEWKDGNAILAGKKSNWPYVRAYKSDGTAMAVGDYYLGIIPTTFTKGFTVVLQMLDGTQLMKKTDKEITLAENQILPMKPLKLEDYDAEYVNYFVKYTEGYDLSIGGVTINKTTHSKATLVTNSRNNTIQTDGLYFITPATSAALYKDKDGSHKDWVIIGAEKGRRSDIKITSHITLGDAGLRYILANLTVSYGTDAGVVRSRPSSFESIVISDCAFKGMTRTLIDMDGGKITDSTDPIAIERIVIEDSEFGFNKSAAYVFNLRGQNANVTNFLVRNNIFYACEDIEMTDFKLISGFNSSTKNGVSIVDYTVEDNTFYNTTGTAFVSIAGASRNMMCNRNLLVGKMTQNVELITIFQVGDALVLPESGDFVNNYFYTTSGFIYTKPSKYTANLRGGSPVKLTSSPLSPNPVNK